MQRFVVFFAIIAAILACGPNESSCGSGCYNPSTSSCVTDAVTGNLFICSPAGYLACNGACYSASQYHCANGGLQGGPAPTSAATPASSTTSSTAAATKAPTTSSTTSSSTKAPTTSSSAATKAPTTSTTSSAAATKASTFSTSSAAATTSSSPAAATKSSSSAAATTSSSNAAASTSASCNSAGCGAGLCNCNGACYTPSQYNCAVDVYNGKNQLCQGSYGSCNGNCFDSTKSSCSSSGNIVVNGAGNNGGTPASSTYVPPVVAPPPAPANRPSQTADLRIINSCKTTLWFEGRYGGAGAPIPGQSVTSIQAPPGAYIDYTVPDTGLGGTRFWAKYGCDVYGKNCLIGDAMQYWPNPPGGCPAGGCTPPVDSLFEATWGCRPGASCNSANPTTWFDTSQVDGWTIPYKLTPNGDTSGCDCIGSSCGFKGVDASRLDLANCPSGEDLSNGGQFPTANVNGQTKSLSAVDLRIINNGSVIGCMSPCKRLNWGLPYGLQQDESSGATMWMCCPTPTPSDCSPSNGCITPTACRNGPIEKTKFVAAVHDMAPGVYSYSYDDGVGLHACPAGVVTYTMEFCPSGSASYPLQL